MIVRGSALALIAAVFCLALGAPAHAGCVGLSGTADGFDKETAVSRAQLALADYITIQGGETSRRRQGERAACPPSTLLAFHLSAAICSRPDIVNARSYTVCWHGVVSPYVCTSGAKICW
jgi:hypothetical protein